MSCFNPWHLQNDITRLESEVRELWLEVARQAKAIRDLTKEKRKTNKRGGEEK